MKTFTSFRGISPDNVRSRYSDSIFEDQRRRFFGDRSFDNGYELTIPNANITEYDEEQRTGYLIELAAPGYNKEDFELTVHENILTISGELGEDRVRTRESYRRQEHNYHSFSRSWTLPEGIDEDSIAASYRNGILEVFIPVNKNIEKVATPRRIQVGS